MDRRFAHTRDLKAHRGVHASHGASAKPAQIELKVDRCVVRFVNVTRPVISTVRGPPLKVMGGLRAVPVRSLKLSVPLTVVRQVSG